MVKPRDFVLLFRLNVCLVPAKRYMRIMNDSHLGQCHVLSPAETLCGRAEKERCLDFGGA